jgi:hypothetical protein
MTLHGGLLSAISETPTSFPAPKSLGLTQEVQFLFYSILFKGKSDFGVGL